ncbi:transketolase [Clostridium sp. SM-530-WT-3G]|uniref:transketolase n=1 Tax=Clostridium sp. SM-530-WT-3G TaxID=2725303 RepID=UPI00145D1115|nr:transketolase [Clostridium sp. SM-530-WT-3G]NME82783.1 transketolase [Clostridium sp. SM-530-WT-3G]
MIRKEKKIQLIAIGAREMRRKSIEMIYNAKNFGGHIGGSLSIIEIMATLYIGVMNINESNVTSELRDRFILSKGHGVLALYTALNQIGIISNDDLATFKSNDTYLYGHPSMKLDKGIEFSSGSLGQGLSLGVGSCLALKKKNNLTSRVFVLLGDGECDEGAIWEAAASASHYNLNNIVAIVDKNGLQYDGETKNVLSMESLSEKWKAFGWNVIDVDGHDIEQLYDALTKKSDMPIAIIANTIKGKGVSFMENNPLWHHSKLSKEQFESAMNELEV